MEYKNLLSHSKTRWLSLLPAIERTIKLFNALKSFFLSEEKPPKILLDFFNNPLSEAYLLFLQSQCSIFHVRILKIEGKKNSIIEILNVIKSTDNTLMEKLQVRFVPIQVKSILDQYFENGVISKYEIDKF